MEIVVGRHHPFHATSDHCRAGFSKRDQISPLHRLAKKSSLHYPYYSESDQHHSQNRSGSASSEAKDALTYLNSLQTCFTVLDERRKNPTEDLQKSDMLQEMFQWVDDADYKPSDFNRLNIVHVAGTKGKGTTCAFVNSILSQYHGSHGLPRKVGMYTSPHLLSVRERIRIDSMPISEEKFTRYFFELWDRLDKGTKMRSADPHIKPAYFRYLTLLSMHAFMQEQGDVAIHEVGVGGQFDSTNVIDKPAVVGITSLGIDHVRVLGGTIEEIAWHKAGIMKHGSPAYAVWQPEGAMQVLQKRAEEKHVLLIEVPFRDVAVEPDENFQDATPRLRLHRGRRDPTTGLMYNQILVLEQALPEPFITGIRSVIWRGRAEMIEKGYGTWFLDGAHTDESLEIVSDWFGRTIERARSETAEMPMCILIFNQQAKGRDAKRLIDTVQQRLLLGWNVRPEEAIFCTNVTYMDKRYKLDFHDGNTDPNIVSSLTIQHDYANWWKQNDPKSLTHVLPSIEDAVETVRRSSEASTDRPVYILATGSFRLVGGVLTILEGEAIATEPSTSLAGAADAA